MDFDMNEFEEDMLEREVYDFSAFTLSEEEMEKQEKEENDQIKRDAEELAELINKAEEARVSDAQLSNSEVRRIKKLSSNTITLICAMTGASPEEIKEQAEEKSKARREQDKLIRKALEENRNLTRKELEEILNKKISA